MPATEATWRNVKLLHVVFGVTSVVMLISTVWMFALDVGRQWKGYQRKYRAIEQQVTTWQIDAEQDRLRTSEVASIEEQLSAVRSASVSEALVTRFKELVNADASRRQVGPPDFSRIDAAFQQLKAAQSGIADLTTKYLESKKALAQGMDSLAQATDPASRNDKEKALQVFRKESKSAEAALKKAQSAAAAARNKLVQAGLRPEFRLAKFREEGLARQRKFRLADYDAAKADLDILVRDNRPASEQVDVQAAIDKIKGDVDELTRSRDSATAYRQSVQDLLSQISSDETKLLAKEEAARAEVARLEKSKAERNVSWFSPGPIPLPGKRWLELPILDAFNSPLTIDNLWTKDLMVQNGSFGSIRRFDRCTTCHRGIAKSAPGTADKPAYVPEHIVKVRLRTPDAAPVATAEGTSPDVASVYGLVASPRGLVNDSDITVASVQPGSLAAEASVYAENGPTDIPIIQGLQAGDVLVEVNRDLIRNLQDVATFLLQGRKWGETVELTVRRGLPQPFTSHPRLDLFVGSMSPHNFSFMGCTSCHEGQGGGTAFEFASHTPNTPAEGREWGDKHGWFNNDHWIFPMYPSRFAESACVKCHHDIYELHPSERFPQDPAPKLVRGHTLIEDYGCYGCHEINGYDGPNRRVGPDLRLEPNYFAAAAAVKADAGFTELDEETRAAVETLIQNPFEDNVRHQVRDTLLLDRDSESPKLSAATLQVASVLDDIETPGKLRKTGPSLRFVAQKLTPEFMYDWIRDPTNFRPSTKMPRFFGLWDHLGDDPKPLEVAKRFEPIEIRGVVQYLMDRSQDFEYIPKAAGTEAPSAERGKAVFEIRGCIACHQHEDFPQVTSLQGPNLTYLGDKFTKGGGKSDAANWLYSWLRQPTHYSPRTRMPNLYLDPVKQADGKLTDPAADLAAYLLSSTHDWKVSSETIAGLQPDMSTLDEVVLLNLRSAYDEPQSMRILADGIPEASRPPLAAAESELVAPISVEKKLNYVGRKTITKYGCFGCHDIPGFEDAKPIGAALADWGRKESAKLAFEHITEYLHQGHGHGGHSSPATPANSATDHVAPGNAHGDGNGVETEKVPAQPDSFYAESKPSFDESFYVQKIEEQNRAGFVWQKLKEPRSYDFKKTENKNYNERLRMPMFPFGPEDREAIVTFVLGLVADPPAEAFVYKAEPRRKAITEGLAVLEKFNCAGCHMLEPDRWSLEYHSGDFGEANTIADFPFAIPPRSEKQLQASAVPDSFRKTMRAVIQGTPAIQNSNGMQEVWDEEGDPVEEGETYPPESLQYPFDLSQSVALDGQLFEAGISPLVVPAATIRAKFPAHGGDLPRWLVSRIVEIEKLANPSANAKEAWGWMPPPLMGEGRKVQPQWLYSFLLEPYPIRPSVFLRMPKFNMSPDDAEKLVNYFGARDAAVFPYDKNERLRSDYGFASSFTNAESLKREQQRMDGAMKIVTDTNYCVKCHLIGDYAPEGSVRAQAPDLSLAQFRLRPDYMRSWIANPKRVLHYSPMPVNIPYLADDPHLGGVSQELLAGTSIDQIDALVQLLKNYSYYTSSKTDVKALVQKAALAAPPAASPTPDTPKPTSTPVAPASE